jgi:hypothetical protein
VCTFLVGLKRVALFFLGMIFTHVSRFGLRACDPVFIKTYCWHQSQAVSYCCLTSHSFNTVTHVDTELQLGGLTMLAVDGEGFRRSLLRVFTSLKLFLFWLFISYDVFSFFQGVFWKYQWTYQFFYGIRVKGLEYNLNFDSVIYFSFQLNILRVEHHLLK